MTTMIDNLKIYYCPATDSLHQVEFFTSKLAIYSTPIEGGAFIHISTLNVNMIFIGDI